MTFEKFFYLFVENYDGSALADILPSSLGLSNRMIHLPDNRPYGFWMDRHGNFIPVKGPQQHGAVAEHIIANANENLPSYSQIDIDEISSFYDYLLKAGWVRIVTTPSKVYWETYPGERPTNSQIKNMKFMKDFYELESVEFG